MCPARRRRPRPYLVPSLYGSVEVDYTICDRAIPHLGDTPHPHPQYWYDLQWRMLDRDGWRCTNCNSRWNLLGHHRSYARWGRERLEDLYTLCRECHENFHAHRRLAG